MTEPPPQFAVLVTAGHWLCPFLANSTQMQATFKSLKEARTFVEDLPRDRSHWDQVAIYQMVERK